MSSDLTIVGVIDILMKVIEDLLIQFVGDATSNRTTDVIKQEAQSQTNSTKDSCMRVRVVHEGN